MKDGVRLTNLLRSRAAFTPCLASAWSATGGRRFDWSDEFDRNGSPIIPDTWKWEGNLVNHYQMSKADGTGPNGTIRSGSPMRWENP